MFSLYLWLVWSKPITTGHHGAIFGPELGQSQWVEHETHWGLTSFVKLCLVPIHKDPSWALDAWKITFYRVKSKTCQVMHWMWQPSVHLDASKKCFLNYIWIFCMLREAICMSSTDTGKFQAVLGKLYKHKYSVCQISCLGIREIAAPSWFCIYVVDQISDEYGAFIKGGDGNSRQIGELINNHMRKKGGKCIRIPLLLLFSH